MTEPANLDTAQAAVLLGFEVRTLERWRTQRPRVGPPSWKAGDGKTDSVRYRRADLEGWVHRRVQGIPPLVEAIRELETRAGMLKDLIPEAQGSAKSWAAQGRWEGMCEALDALRAFETPAAQDGAES
jgi:hypothetical protein